MRKRTIAGGSVPMLNPRRNHHHITLGQGTSCFSPFLVPSDPIRDKQKLSPGMRMPVVTATRLKFHIADCKSARLIFGNKGQNPGSTRKILGWGHLSPGKNPVAFICCHTFIFNVLLPYPFL